jgi:hypothetical protein
MVNGILVHNHVDGRKICLETFDVLDECGLGCRQMDGAISSFLNDWYMHRWAAVFDGERRGINGADVGNVIRQINDSSGGLNKGEANNGVHCHVRSRCDDDAHRRSVLREEWWNWKPTISSIVMDSPHCWTIPDRTMG